jgi:DNA-binding beta-propeller fold protein YncE
LGDPLPGSAPAGALLIAPKGNYALAQDDSRSSVSIASLSNPLPLIWSPIAGALAGADQITFSPTGASAVFYSSQNGTYQLVTGLPEAPKVGIPFSVSGTSERVVALALSDDGAALFIADSAGEVWSAINGNLARVVYQGGAVSCISVLPNAHDVLICDSSANTVGLVREGSAPVPLVSNRQGFTQPVAVVVTADGTGILICAGANKIWSVDRNSRKISILDSPIPDPVLKPLGHDAFLISSVNGGSMWALQWDRVNPAFFFVAQSRHVASAQ